MVNHRLRAAINASGLTHEQLAQELKVNPKTVERWITHANTPYPRHRHGLTERLGKPEEFFWPELFEEPADKVKGLVSDDLVRLYPQRSSVPTKVWDTLLAKASKRIDLLVYAGLFLVELRPDLVTILAEKAAAGTAIRLLLGDPGCPAVAERGEEEGTREMVAEKIHKVLPYYRDLGDQPNVSVRFHQTTLYASIYQFDEEMLVNTHIYGLPAAHAPTLHLRRRSSSPLFDTYIMNFERVWQNAHSSWPDG